MKGGRAEKTDVLQGTLILLVLRTPETPGPLHGYGIARRTEQFRKEVLQLNQGTLYPALLRMASIMESFLIIDQPGLAKERA